jgi:hypothetical protein
VNTWAGIDQRVLRWVLEQSDAPEWRSRIIELTLRPEPEPCAEFDGGPNTLQMDEALLRLRGYGLTAGNRHETEAAIWSHLRITADGLILLGEWPDLDRVASFEGVQVMLAALAKKAEDPDDKSALRRTAGAIGRLGQGVVETELESLGEGIVGQ